MIFNNFLSWDSYAFLLLSVGTVFLYLKIRALKKEKQNILHQCTTLSRVNDKLNLGIYFGRSDYRNLSQKYASLHADYKLLGGEYAQLLNELEGLRQEKEKRLNFSFFKKRESNKTEAKSSYADFDINDDVLIAAATEYDGFEKKPIFNRAETEVFRVLRQLLQRDMPNLHIHGQASLGELVKTKEKNKDKASLSARAFMAINSKRADMVIVDEVGAAVLFIEVQGDGHFGVTPQDKIHAENRDKIKKIILNEKLGVPILEISSKDIDSNRVEMRAKEMLVRAFGAL